MNKLQTQWLQIDGHPFAYQDIGQGPALLFCHSLLTHKGIWSDQIAELSKNYRCIAVDLWGHGESSQLPSTTQSLPHIATQLLYLMQQLNIEQFAIIGMGSGAAIATEMTLSAPERIQALVMLNSFVGFEPEVNCKKYQQWMDAAKQPAFELDTTLKQIAPLYTAKTATDDSALNDALDAITPLKELDSTHKQALLNMAHMCIYKRDSLEDVEQLTLPCLIMVGVENKLRTVLESYLMHDAIDGSQLVHLPQCGHLAQLDNAGLVNQHLLAFLKQEVQ